MHIIVNQRLTIILIKMIYFDFFKNAGHKP